MSKPSVIFVPDNEKDCIPCKSELISCPVCPSGTVCHTSVRTCTECPIVKCVPDPNAKTSSTNIPMIVGICLVVIVALSAILVIIGRRRFRRHKVLFGEEKKSHSDHSPSKRGSSYRYQSNLKFFQKFKSRKPSASFSMLNFESHTILVEEDHPSAIPPATTRQYPARDSVLSPPLPTLHHSPANPHPNHSEASPSKFTSKLATWSRYKSQKSPSASTVSSSSHWNPRFPALGAGLNMADISQSTSIRESTQVTSPMIGLDVEKLLAIQFQPHQPATTAAPS